ncbi:TolC family outer membrane protein [Salidesulfovibrio onnuriiensis]|uniref:TolC family outer membrane protein n=1 Tax=Salidesulfovibrio onnuriiensis TaxID=2583823 RepID=UPI0011C76954|nr:TolC family outer membrane protein [Salidesulfovibrio onnuriiensis]
MKRLLIVFCLIFLLAPSAYAGADGTTSLKESVVMAVKQHPQIKALLHNREAMSRNLAASLGRFFPSLDLTSKYGFQEYSSTTTRNDGSDERQRTATDTTVAMTLNVFDGMDRIYTYQGSEARLESAEYRLRDNVETVGLDAIRSHHDVVRERLLVTLAQDNVEKHNELLDSITERVMAGATSRADETQAKSRLARAFTTLITYQGNLRAAEASYTRVTGKTPGALASPEYHPELVADMDSIMKRTMDNNPKLKAGEADLHAKEKDEKVTRSDYFPNVDVVVSSRNTDNLDGSDSYLRDNRAMLEMSWNLFSGGTDYNETQAAKARTKEAASTLQDTTDDLIRQVVTAWTEYETAVSQVENYERAVGYSVETRDMYLIQFNVGQRSLLDVLDSINEVFSNSVLLETAKSNRSYSLYKLMTLRGDLIRTLEVADKTYDPESK